MYTRSVWLAGLMICLIGLPELGQAQDKGNSKSKGSEGRSSARPERSRPTPSVNRSRGRSPEARPSPSRTPSSSSRNLQRPTRSAPTPSSSRSTPSIIPDRKTPEMTRPGRIDSARPSSPSSNRTPSIDRGRTPSSLESLRNRLQQSRPADTAQRSNDRTPPANRDSNRGSSSSIRDLINGRSPASRTEVNRPDLNRENRPSTRPDANPGSRRPDGAQPSRDFRDMFNRMNRPDTNPGTRPGTPSTERGPGATPDRTPGSSIRDRFRPGDASDIRDRLRDMNRGNTDARPSIPGRGDQDRPDPSQRDRRPGIDRDSIRDRLNPGASRPDVNRPEIGRPEIDRPGRDRPDGERPNGNRPDMNRPDRDRPGADRPGPRPGTPNDADRNRPDRGDRDRGDQNRGDRDRVVNRPEVRPDFDWRDRVNRDPQFRERLEDVRQRGSLDRDSIRDRLANVENRFRDGDGDRDRGPNRGDRGPGDRGPDGDRDRDGNRDRDRDGDRRRGDWDRDRDWDGRWDDRHRRHVPDNWYRHAHDVRRHGHNHFRYGWNDRWYPRHQYLGNWYFHRYRPRPGYWWSWATPYRLSTWSFWGTYPTYPVYYDYGSTIVYDTQYVYVEEEPIATREQYALEAIALANEGRKILQSRPPVEGNGNPEDWLPMGVFVLTDTESGEGDIYLQLAVDKEGLIAGTYFNATTETSLPVWGKVDPQSQRAAWLIGERSATVMETGIYNLSQEAASVLVHYGTGRDETWMLVRLPEDEVTETGNL